MAGNEANFFIRDATNGSTLPFRIFPGAPSNSLTVENTGDVGIGTTNPKSMLHVFAADNIDSEFGVGDDTSNPGNCAAVVGHAGASLKGTAFLNARECPGGTPGVALSVEGLPVLLATTGNVAITGDVVISGGNCSDDAGGGGCTADYVFEPGYELESIEDHAAYMWDKSHLPAVGKGADTLNVLEANRGMLEELEKAHIYIERLNDKLKAKDGELSEVSDRLARLEALVKAQ